MQAKSNNDSIIDSEVKPNPIGWGISTFVYTVNGKEPFWGFPAINCYNKKHIFTLGATSKIYQGLADAIFRGGNWSGGDGFGLVGGYAFMPGLYNSPKTFFFEYNIAFSKTISRQSSYKHLDNLLSLGFKWNIDHSFCILLNIGGGLSNSWYYRDPICYYEELPNGQFVKTCYEAVNGRHTDKNTPVYLIKIAMGYIF